MNNNAAWIPYSGHGYPWLLCDGTELTGYISRDNGFTAFHGEGGLSERADFGLDLSRRTDIDFYTPRLEYIGGYHFDNACDDDWIPFIGTDSRIDDMRAFDGTNLG